MNFLILKSGPLTNLEAKMRLVLSDQQRRKLPSVPGALVAMMTTADLLFCLQLVEDHTRRITDAQLRKNAMFRAIAVKAQRDFAGWFDSLDEEVKAEIGPSIPAILDKKAP